MSQGGDTEQYVQAVIRQQERSMQEQQEEEGEEGQQQKGDDTRREIWRASGADISLTIYKLTECCFDQHHTLCLPQSAV